MTSTADDQAEILVEVFGGLGDRKSGLTLHDGSGTNCSSPGRVSQTDRAEPPGRLFPGRTIPAPAAARQSPPDSCAQPAAPAPAAGPGGPAPRSPSVSFQAAARPPATPARSAPPADREATTAKAHPAPNATQTHSMGTPPLLVCPWPDRRLPGHGKRHRTRHE